MKINLSILTFKQKIELLQYGNYLYTRLNKTIEPQVCIWLQIKKSAYFTIHRPIILFGTIHESHCTILANFYLYLQYF